MANMKGQRKVAGNRRNSDLASYQVQSVDAHLFSATPMKMVKKLAPAPKVERKVHQPDKMHGGTVRLTDEQVFEMIRRNRAGESYKEISKAYGIRYRVAWQLCTGQNRGYILRMIEEGYESYRYVCRKAMIDRKTRK